MLTNVRASSIPLDVAASATVAVGAGVGVDVGLGVFVGRAGDGVGSGSGPQAASAIAVSSVIKSSVCFTISVLSLGIWQRKGIVTHLNQKSS
jgi:hypothetical protein